MTKSKITHIECDQQLPQSVEVEAAKGQSASGVHPYLKMPSKDHAWALEQSPPVYKLFGEAWQSDPYGTKWMPLKTTLKGSNLRKAKLVLEQRDLFLFKVEMERIGGDRIYETYVKNLHGSRTAYLAGQLQKMVAQPSAEVVADSLEGVADKDSPAADRDSPAADRGDLHTSNAYTASVSKSVIKDHKLFTNPPHSKSARNAQNPEEEELEFLRIQKENQPGEQENWEGAGELLAEAIAQDNDDEGEFERELLKWVMEVVIPSRNLREPPINLESYAQGMIRNNRDELVKTFNQLIKADNRDRNNRAKEAELRARAAMWDKAGIYVAVIGDTDGVPGVIIQQMHYAACDFLTMEIPSDPTITPTSTITDAAKKARVELVRCRQLEKKLIAIELDIKHYPRSIEEYEIPLLNECKAHQKLQQRAEKLLGVNL